MKAWDEFRKFAFKGNVVDMAVGVIIGSAFSGIINSVVNDLFMPLLGQITAGVDFKDLKLVISEAVMEGDAIVKAENAIMYGSVIQAVINFFLIAVSVFVFVSIIGKGRAKLEEREKKKNPTPEPAPEPPKGPTQEELLVEIRDLLKNKN